MIANMPTDVQADGLADVLTAINKAAPPSQTDYLFPRISAGACLIERRRRVTENLAQWFLCPEHASFRDALPATIRMFRDRSAAPEEAAARFLILGQLPTRDIPIERFEILSLLIEIAIQSIDWPYLVTLLSV